MTKHFIICGFNEGDIEEYAESTLSGEKLMEFKKDLSIHPHIQSIMYVPLHSNHCHGSLPTTQTAANNTNTTVHLASKNNSLPIHHWPTRV